MEKSDREEVSGMEPVVSPHIVLLNDQYEVVLDNDGKFMIKVLNGFSPNIAVRDLEYWYANERCPIEDQVSPRSKDKNIVTDWVQSPYRNSGILMHGLASIGPDRLT